MNNIKNSLTYKVVFLVVCLFLFSLKDYAQADYPRIFGQKFTDAVQFYHQHQREIQSACIEHKREMRATLSLVFPELIRYNANRDAVEMMGNRVLYVNLGGEYGDFSVGCFQMKPSFIEKMEQFIKDNPNKMQNFASLAKYTESSESDIRKARLQRLSLLKWQLNYLFCFLTIIDNRFPNLSFDKEYRHRFYATAYNRGFDCSESEILKWKSLKSYPDGYRYNAYQYNYSDIAWAVYQHFEKWLR